MRAEQIADVRVYRHEGPPGAPTLALLHGFSDSGLTWGDAVRRWQPSYTVVTWDARGHGAGPRFRLDELDGAPAKAMVADAVTVLDQLRAEGAQRIAAVGHSMGGNVASWAAAVRPDLVDALVLEDPAFPPEPVHGAGDVQWGQVQAAGLAAARADPAGLLAAGRRDNPHWPPAEVEPWAVAKTQTDLAFAAAGRALVWRSWTEVLPTLRMPTLLVTGTVNVLWPADHLTEVTCTCAAVTTYVVPDADHCVRRSRTEAFHSVVDPWLADALQA